MAESAVSFLLEKLSKLLTEEAKLLGNVRQEVAHIKDYMDAMRAFLRDADAKLNTSEEVKLWVRQVRELAYDTEDVLDEFMVRLGRQNRSGFIGTLSKGIRFIKHVKARHQIATQIKEIRGQIRDLAERRSAFAFRRFDEGTSSSPNVASLQKWQDPRVAAHFLEEDEVIGIEGPRDELIKRLVEGAPQLTVISVLGMGGLGKTTLVKKIYDKPEVQSYFEGEAWITVSQSFDVEDLLKSMIKQFFDARKDPTPDGINSMKDVQLMKIIKDYLQEKSYLRDGSFHSTQGVHLPSGIGNLISLEKLAYVDVGHDIEMVKAMGKLIHLNRLGIVNFKSIDGEIMCVSIEKMKELSSLAISAADEEEVLNLQSLACPQRLQHVFLRGRLEKIPGWITSQQSLVRVSLRWCKLRDDPLKALQALPNLVELHLGTACYDGKELRCEEGTFPKLKALFLVGMDKLNTVTLGERAMVGLPYLEIVSCQELKALPLGIERLTNLKELHLRNISDELVEGLREDGGSDHWKIKLIPLVQHWYIMNGKRYVENLV